MVNPGQPGKLGVSTRLWNSLRKNMHIYLHFIITYNIKLLKVVTDELRWLCSSLAHTSGIQFTTEC